jgi:hypothetical protein
MVRCRSGNLNGQPNRSPTSRQCLFMAQLGTEALASTIGGSLGISAPAGEMTHRCGQSSGSRGKLSPSPPLAARSSFASLPAQGGEGGRNDGQPLWRSTGHPTACRSAHRVCMGQTPRHDRRRPDFGDAARGTDRQRLTRLRSDTDCRPSLTLRHPWLPDLPSPSLPAQGGEGARERCLNHRVGQLTANGPAGSA